MGAAADLVCGLLPPASSSAVTLVCVDGPGGSGKSTLAAAVVASRPDVQVVHGDDFYGPETRDWRSWSPREGYERCFDRERLQRDVLDRLAGGEPARFRRHDWSTNTLGGWVKVRPSGVNLVEGVYVFRQRLRGYWDLSVYVDTPRDVRRSRAYQRGENDEAWIERWAAAEDYYEAVEHPAEAADLVVPGG